MFYKASSTDKAFNINTLMPVTNSDVGIITIHGTAQVQDGGNTAQNTITVTIVKNCDIETLTAPGSISDIIYTFNAASVVVTLPETISSFPTLCPVTHDLEIKDPTFAPFASTSFIPLVSYVVSTRTITVSYSVDNEFSPLDGANTIEM